jgi:hypothetical protein
MDAVQAEVDALCLSLRKVVGMFIDARMQAGMKLLPFDLFA